MFSCEFCENAKNSDLNWTQTDSHLVGWTHIHLFYRTPPDDCFCTYLWQLFKINFIRYEPFIAKLIRVRSSHQSSFIKKSVLKNFSKFTGKHLCRRLFLTKLKTCSAMLLKKRLRHRNFSVIFGKFFKMSFYRTHQKTASEEWNEPYFKDRSYA